MRNLKYFRVFENQNLPIVSIEEFLREIRIDSELIPSISEWWNENRSGIEIYFFPFQCEEPISGVFLDDNKICVNSRMAIPSHIKLFLALHESRHCDQQKSGIFMEGYYDTVLNDDIKGFLKTYLDLEKDANDFAISSMREIGFSREFDIYLERHLRGNERAGNAVYSMMKKDIEKYKPTDFFDLLKKQIGFYNL